MRTTLLCTLVIIVLFISCAKKSVRIEDLDVWKGVDVIELETHPIFSTMKLEKANLSDGTVMYSYINSRNHTTPINCYNIGGAYNKNMACSGGNSVEIKCTNQFFVKKGKVIGYRPLGRCYTDCSVRPSSKPCTKD